MSRSGTSGASGTLGSVSVCGMNQSKGEFKAETGIRKTGPICPTNTARFSCFAFGVLLRHPIR